MKNRKETPATRPAKPVKRLTKKQSQWAWFIGLYVAGLLTIVMIAKLIKWAMGI